MSKEIELNFTAGIKTMGKTRWTIERIECEAQELYQKTGALKRIVLEQEGRRDLLGAIDRSYPGKLTALQVNLGLELSHKPKGYYTVEKIEAEAQAFVGRYGKLSSGLLEEKGKSTLAVYIRKKYPGGMEVLRTKFGVEGKYTMPGFWTEGRIRTRALDFYKENGRISHDLLVKAGESRLVYAIWNHYPGRMQQLKHDMGVGFPRQQLSLWTQEQIEREAFDFYKREGKLTFDLLARRKKYTLRHAILQKYPGGIFSLRTKLGLENSAKPSGYWTFEKTRKEAIEFYYQNRELNYKTLTRAGRGGLMGAISVYPGRLTQLKKDLGITLERILDWNPKIIEEEAQQFFKKNGALTHKTLKNFGKGDLSHAISRHYPGGMMALKGKLSIVHSSHKESLSPEQANEQLRRILET